MAASSIEKLRVLVTGAEGALGKAVTQRFLSGGHLVDGTFLKEKPAASELKEVHQWIQVDLGQPESVKTAFARHSYDVVVHCAGGFRYAVLEETPNDALAFLMNTNLLSAFYVLREVLPEMKKQKFGRIVLVSSRATLEPAAGLSAYSASKAGLNLLVASLTQEVKDFDINVNAVLPSVLDTPANRKDMPQADFSKWVKLEQISEIIYSLTQSWGDPIRGALIPVSGRV